MDTLSKFLFLQIRNESELVIFIVFYLYNFNKKLNYFQQYSGKGSYISLLQPELFDKYTLETRPGDLVGAGPNWVTFWSKFGLF